jgi:hypothetical protein
MTLRTLCFAATCAALAPSAAAGAPAAPVPGGLAILLPCTASQLRATVASDTGAMMHRELTIALTNTGARACAIDGFPAVRLLDVRNRAVIAAESFSGTPREFTIGPGQQAAFTMRIATGDGVTAYRTVPTLAILPPGDVAPVLLALSLPSAPTIDVTALVPIARVQQ